MSQRKPTTDSPKSRRATTQSKTSLGDTTKHKQQEHTTQQPASDDREGWKAYWTECQQPWRTEPEITLERQAELHRCRVVVPNISQGIYPFKGMQLSRADVEWLLATHENGVGPVNWSDKNQRQRGGLDLRGADLRGVNLSYLPFARLRLGLNDEEWRKAEKDPLRYEAAAHVEKAVLIGAHLEGACCNRTFFERATLSEAYLEQADFTSARLEHVRLRNAHLENAELKWAHLEYAHLRGSNLCGANLTSAYLEGAHLENVLLGDKDHAGPRVADMHWNDVNLAVVNWSQVAMLGDEYEAHQNNFKGKAKDNSIRLNGYQVAVRANRQIAVTLQSQGLNEIATRFSYRAQVLQRIVFQLQMMQQSGVAVKQRMRASSAWLFSWFLFLLAGYGYKPERSFLAYLLVIGVFMAFYLHLDPHLVWYEAIVVSMTAFHGRGFSPSTFSPGDPVSIASAIEAFVGLIIEVTFTATLTQRFFNR